MTAQPISQVSSQIIPQIIPQWLIEKKRDGGELSPKELRAFVMGYLDGQIPDYQMSAMAMAIYFKDMTLAETAALTEIMLNSGELVDTSRITAAKVDKHSTGGIGDKISLVLAPLAAAAGLAVPMISGRGLGITGGTLDKLESIPGYRCDLSEKEFLEVVIRCGCSINGQTAQLAPADRKLYALRDVTGTVPSIPLIVSSILSKKLAEGIDCLVLDVKLGSGALMKRPADAKRLAETLVGVAQQLGKNAKAVITDMNQPLGRSVGNALEVKEVIEVLKNRGPDDVRQLTLTLTAQMMILAKQSSSEQEARAILEKKLSDGSALDHFKQMLSLQGADPAVIEQPQLLPQAPVVIEHSANSSGYVSCVDAEQIGRAALLLGAGRTRIEDSVNHAVGVSELVKCGEKIEQGRPLALVHAADAQSAAAVQQCLEDAIIISDKQCVSSPLVIEEVP